MKRFRFRLQSVLDYREYLEHLARQEAARAYQDVLQAEEEIAALKTQYRAADEALDKASAKGMSALQFKAYQDFLNAVEREISAQTSHRETLKKQLLKKQKDLTRRSIARKVMEKLKEKKKRRYLEDSLKLDQSIIDEIVSVKKAREINDGAS